MRIKKTKLGFTDNIVIGMFGLIIILDDNGLEVSNTSLVEQSKHFSLIIIKGKETMKQKYEICDFIKKIKKKNEKIKIIIETDGFLHPVGLNNIDNIEFIVFPIMKKSNISLDKRINYKTLNWYSEVGAKFKFYIDSIDELDEAEMLINGVGIKKINIYFVSKNNNNLEFIFKSAIDSNCNVALDTEEMFEIEEAKE